MELPVIAIVGRPNVGKSTLLNAVAGRRVSVVDPTEGVTRDRVGVVMQHAGRAFELLDTGGIGIVDVQDLSEHVEHQIAVALETSAVIVFLVDARAGLSAFDSEIGRRLHELGKPVVFAANKAESVKIRQSLHEFEALGFGAPIELSAQNRENTGALIAIAGRRNAGKSTLVNAIANDDRVIVSEKPGTTRDAVDVWIERGDEAWVLIDTAGFTRHAHDGKDPIQWYSEHRALRAIRSCDVAILLLDVTLKVGGLEKRLAEAIEKAGKPCLLAANKWDLVKDVRTGKFEEYYHGTLPGLLRAPLAFLSAKDGLNVDGVLGLCSELYEQSQFELGTGELNRFIAQALETRAPRVKTGQRPRVYYATQVSVGPPTFAVYVNDPHLFDPSFRRFLQNRFRDTYPVREVPVRFDFRRRERKSLSDLKGGL
jgi:GTP-binding protein